MPYYEYICAYYTVLIMKGSQNCIAPLTAFHNTVPGINLGNFLGS